MRTALAAIVLVLAAEGCGGDFPQAPPIPNPMRAGSVRANTVVVWQSDEVEAHQLRSDALASQASLVALDARAVCFDLYVRTLDPVRPAIDFARWRYRLDVGARRGVATEPAIQREGRESVATVMGHSNIEGRSRVDARSRCPRVFVAGRGRSPVSRPVDAVYNNYRQYCDDGAAYQVDSEPVAIAIASRGARVCFDHRGAIDRATRSIALEMASPSGAMDPLRWQWDFTPR